jgi:hypothetical protein
MGRRPEVARMSTTLSRIARIALLLTATSAIARAQTVLFQDDFENGPWHWVASGPWHLESSASPCAAASSPFPSGTHAMYSGLERPCNYDTGSQVVGALLLADPVFLPPDSPRAVVRYWSLRCAEPCLEGFDHTLLQVSTNGGASWTTVHTACTFSKTACDSLWRVFEADISAFIGTTIRVRFFFDTVDELYNFYEGWRIDDVSIRLQPGQPYTSGNCPCLNLPAGSGAFFCSCITGCVNSVGGWGELGGSGFPKVSQDDVQLFAHGMPEHASATFLQGHVAGILPPFGDGVLSLNGATVRLGTKICVGGAARYPEAQDVPISVKGGVPAAGAQLGYQVLYRDSNNFCTPSQVNTTNGYRIIWVP